MILDIKTIMIVYSLFNLMSFATMYFLWREYRNRYNGLGFWLADMGMQFIAIILIVLRGTIPMYISSVIANLLAVMGLYFVLSGYKKFIGREEKNIFNYILIFCFSIIFSYFTIISENLQIRDIILSITLSILSVELFYETIFKTFKELKKVSLILGIIMFGYMMINIYRIVHHLFFSIGTNDFFKAGNADAITMIVFMLLGIGVIISLILILTERLLIDISLQEEKYKKSFYLAPFAVILSRLSDGKLYDINKTFEIMSGYSKDEIRDKSSIDLNIWMKLEDRKSMIEKLMNRNVIRNEEYFFRKKTGESFVGLLSSEIIEINNEKCLLTTVSDITEQKLMFEKLREAKENAEYLMKTKEELLVTISHDLRTPLNGIMGMSELALITEEKDKKNEYLSIINKSTEHLNTLISSILNNIQNKGNEKFNISLLYDEIRNNFEKKLMEKNLSVYFTTAPNLPDIIKGDYTKLRQIIFNIVENAVKYTEKGGILVSSTVNSIKSSKVDIRFEVEDTGIGIEEKNLSIIFEIYNRGNKWENHESKSYGIGLYNVKKHIEDLGGKISVKSKVNSGSTFSFILEFDILEKSSKSFTYDNNVEAVIITNDAMESRYFDKVMKNYGVKYHEFDTVESYYNANLEKSGLIIVFASWNLIKSHRDFEEEKCILYIYGKKSDDESIKRNLNFVIDDTGTINFILEALKIEIEETDTEIETKQHNYKRYDNLKALVIEDNELNAKILADMLILIGVESFIAKTVEEAIFMVNKKKYDIIFSDFFIKELNAVDFMNQAQNLIPETTIKVVLTATESEKIKKQSIDSGFDLYLEKPYGFDSIVNIFEKYFSADNTYETTEDIIFKDKKEYYQIFMKQLEAEILDIEKNIKIKNHEAIERSTHKIKSGAKLLGESEIAKQLDLITKSAVADDYEAVFLALEIVKMEMDRINIELFQNHN